MVNVIKNILVVLPNSKREHKNVEGKKMFVEHKGSLKDTLVEMQQDLQSSISYAGGKDLKSLTTVDYVIVRNSILMVIEINICLVGEYY